MTEQEFWERARHFRWALMEWEPNRVVRCERGFCPLGAVLADKAIAQIALPGPSYSAKHLGLSEEFTFRVMRAADIENDEDRDWLLENLGVRSPADMENEKSSGVGGRSTQEHP